MRHLRLLLVIAFALAFGLAIPAASTYAQGGVPGGPFATNFRIQNLGGGTATCSYTMYNDNGTQAFAAPQNLTVNANDSTFVYTPSVAGFPPGQFGGVVSCDQNVAVVVNWSDPTKGDVYVASSNPAATLYAPAIYNNFFNFYTSIRILNASGSAQTGVKVEYYGAGSSTKIGEDTVNLAVNGSATVDQAGKAFLARNRAYSAKIVGSGPLAAVVSIFGGTGTPVAKQLYSYSATTGGAIAATYAPLVFGNFFGYSSALNIQNLGSSPSDVRITYTDANGTTVATQTALGVRGSKVSPNETWVVLQSDLAALARNQSYGAKVETLDGQPLAVSVNQSRGALSRAATYIGVSGGSNTVVAPTVFKALAGYNSSITCQNVGTAATNLTISYSGAGTPQNKVVKTGLAQGATFVISQAAETGLANGYSGSATVKSSGQPLVCVVTQDRDVAPYLTQANDYFQAYVAIGQ